MVDLSEQNRIQPKALKHRQETAFMCILADAGKIRCAFTKKTLCDSDLRDQILHFVLGDTWACSASVDPRPMRFPRYPTNLMVQARFSGHYAQCSLSEYSSLSEDDGF